MHNFKRAFKIALRHRFNVVACVFTAAIVAVLWGGNLTAVFPVVEVIMNDHALPDWIDQKIDEAQTRSRTTPSAGSRSSKSSRRAIRLKFEANIRAEIKRREAELDRAQKEVGRARGTTSKSPKRRGSKTKSST